MSQTFAQFKARLASGVQRSDLASSYGLFINEALREIQNRRSWTCMKVDASVSIATGTGRETAALPAAFKEFQRRTAVEYVADDGGFVPADVVTEEQQIYRIWAFGGTPMYTWPPRVFFLHQPAATLGVLEPLSQALNFRVRYYGYLPDLSADGDTSPLINAYPQMVLAKAKAIAFTEIVDPVAAQFEELFEKKLAEAVRQDAYSEVSGRITRLGQGV
jgi:hypothetical protein